MRSIFAIAGLALALVTFSTQQASAAPITYEFSGTGSGAIGSQSFTDALVVYTGTADTDDVATISFMGVTFYAVGLNSLSVNIEGIGTATVTDLSKILGIPEAINDPDGDLPPLPGLMLMRIDHPSEVSNMEKGIGMAGLFSNALAGYDLTTAIGPITDLGGVGFPEDCAPGDDPCIGTSLGLLSFTSNIADDSRGTFAATLEPVPVPEPATLLLMGSGLAAAFGRRSRRRARG